jgi:hypothetical protein
MSLGYIPRLSYRPAPVSSYLDDESSSPLTFEGLGYPTFSHTFSPRLDAETRYRRALHELQASEEEFEADLAVRRARQVAVLRGQAARRERALAIQAEVERIERARALQAKLAEEYEWQERAHQAEVAFGRARRQKHALLHASVDTDRRDLFGSECPLAKRRLTHSRPSRRPVLHDSEVPTLEGLFSRIHPRPQPHSTLQQSGSLAYAPFQHRSAEPQPLSREKQDAEEDVLNAVLEFIHGLAAHPRDAANGSDAVPEVRLLVRSVVFQV